MILHKGTIVVRTGGFRTGGYKEQLEGALFATTRMSDTNSAYYKNSMCIPPSRFRLATTQEIQMYNKGTRNINKSNKSWKDHFCVYTKCSKDLFNKYKNFCLEYNIKFNIHWNGSFNYYGISPEGRNKTGSLSWGQEFTIEEFEKELLINKTEKQNEKISIITTKQRRKNKGTTITSSKKRQIATTSRPRGNRISTRISTRKIAESKISFRAITN